MPLIQGASELLALAEAHWRLGDDGVAAWWAETGRVKSGAARTRARAGRVACAPTRAALREIASRLADQSAWALMASDVDSGYPVRLLHAWCSRAPAVLYGLGDPSLLSRDAIAIIGTRRPSSAGAAAASAWGRGCAKAGWVVASGNAPGVDASGHAGALSVVGGQTVAYIPTSLDQFEPQFLRALAGLNYSRANRRPSNPGNEAFLLHEMLAEGRLVVASPFPLGASVEPWCFLRRNELVAAASGAAVVAETGMRGGTQNTIRHLRALRRPIYVPNFPEGASSRRSAHERLAASGALWTSADCARRDLSALVRAAKSALAKADRDGARHATEADLFAEAATNFE